LDTSWYHRGMVLHFLRELIDLPDERAQREHTRSKLLRLGLTDGDHSGVMYFDANADADSACTKPRRWPNGSIDFSLYLASHECDEGSQCDGRYVELHAHYSGPDPDGLWWTLTLSLLGENETPIRYCPFCGFNLNGLIRTEE
jgi:hypothetical protein